MLFLSCHKICYILIKGGKTFANNLLESLITQVNLNSLIKGGNIMTKLGIQISSVRKYLQTPEDVLESFRKVSKIGYKTIQIQWISPSVPVSFIDDALKETQLDCIGTQDYYDEVIGNLDEIIKMNNLWDGKYICVSGIPERYHSYEGCMSFTAELDQVTKRLASSGKILTFHPRCQDFMQFNGHNSVELLLENTSNDFQIVLDVYHIINAGLNPIDWVHKFKGRMDIIHFKDKIITSEGKEVLVPVGQGSTSWKDIFRACEQTGIKYAFAEQESWLKDPFECLEDSYKFITSHDIK